MIYQCPSACGEIIEGRFEDNNFLSSYMINCYSKLSINAGKLDVQVQEQFPKLYEATQQLAGCHKKLCNWQNEISLSVNSDIPVGKGMGSSTADLIAGLSAVSEFYELDLTPDEITKLCLKVEPTDHSAYQKPLIMDHVTGRIYYESSFKLNMSVLVLEPSSKVDTKKLMQKKHRMSYMASDFQYQMLLENLIKAYSEKNIAWIADVAWESALLNELILKKPYLNSLKKLEKRPGVLGLNIAHTGSIVAVWYDEKIISSDELKILVSEIDYTNYYINKRSYQVIDGGVVKKEVGS